MAETSVPHPLENGPKDEDLDWLDIDWAACEDNVRRLQRRIFKAEQEGDRKKVRNLQKLLLRSRSNTLVSVKRVTQHSSGRATAGIDGKVALTPRDRAALAAGIHRLSKPWKARPVKRVYIPKGSGKQRPLGIPVIQDRANQARVRNALEPEWEAKFEAKSYGFRPGRGCHDAIAAIFNTTAQKNATRLWALDADLSAAFDRINHDHLLDLIETFPGRGAIRGWLKAGVMEGGRFAPTDEGTPQGGVISPLLMNVALHGMEYAAGCRYIRDGRRSEPGAKPDTPVLVRYADDFVVLCHTEEEALQVKSNLANWLEPRGLFFNEDKTSVVHFDKGFDFLGFNIRRYRRKLLIKPSKTAITRVRERLKAEILSLRGANNKAVMKRLAPIIRGWSAYYRTVVSKEVFTSLDNYLWKLTYKWAKHTHPTKPRHWVTNRYFGRFNKSRQNNWVFGDRATGIHLPQFAWTKIVRHIPVKGTASVYDPTLVDYWETRRRKRTPPPMDKTSVYLAYEQKGLCPLCQQALIVGAEYEPEQPRKWIEWFEARTKALHKHHFFVYRRDGGSDDRANLRLVHSECHRMHHAADG